MKILNKKLCYWMEDFQYGRRLTFGCYYPDDLNDDDDELMRQQLVEYLTEHIDLSQYKKLLICERRVFDTENKEEEPSYTWDSDDQLKEMRFKGEYSGRPGYLEAPCQAFVYMIELKSDDANVIGIGCHIVLLVPNEIELTTLSEKLFETLKRSKYSYFHTSEYDELFTSWIKEIPNASLIVNCGLSDVRLFKKIPEYVGTVYVYNLYGELAKHDIPEQYKFE